MSENSEHLINTIMELWLQIYNVGQDLWIFFTTPVNEMVTDGNDFFGVLGGIEYTPFEMMFGIGLTATLLFALFKFFKIELL